MQLEIDFLLARRDGASARVGDSARAIERSLVRRRYLRIVAVTVWGVSKTRRKKGV